MVKKKVDGRHEYTPEAVLGTWRELLQALPYMNEAELEAALKDESEKPDGEKRIDVIHRLHRRFTTVRQKREIKEHGLESYYDEKGVGHVAKKRKSRVSAS